MNTPSTVGGRVDCSEPGCTVKFTRTAEMQRHLDEVHGDMKYCDEPGCTYPGAKRSARLRDHKTRCHPHLYDVPLAVPQPSQFGSFNPPQVQSSAQLQDPQVAFSPHTEGGYWGPHSQQNLPPLSTSTSSDVLTTIPYPTGQGSGIQGQQTSFNQPSTYTSANSREPYLESNGLGSVEQMGIDYYTSAGNGDTEERTEVEEELDEDRASLREGRNC